MKYKAIFDFLDKKEYEKGQSPAGKISQINSTLVPSGAPPLKGRCPISSFSVTGGAFRSIDLTSTDDITISSELEQARKYKNITLFMSPTKNYVDMETAVKLIEAANKQMGLYVIFFLAKYVNGKIVDSLTIGDNSATLKQPPNIVASHLLMIEVCLLSPILIHGTYSGAETQWAEM